MQSAIVFLAINGCEDCLDDEDGYAKTMEIAQKHIPENKRDQYVEQFAQRLSARFKEERRIVRFRLQKEQR